MELEKEIDFFKKLSLTLEFEDQIELFIKTVEKYGYKVKVKNNEYSKDIYLTIKNKSTEREMTLRINKFGYILYSDFEKLILQDDEIKKIFKLFKLPELYLKIK